MKNITFSNLYIRYCFRISLPEPKFLVQPGHWRDLAGASMRGSGGDQTRVEATERGTGAAGLCIFMGRHRRIRSRFPPSDG